MENLKIALDYDETFTADPPLFTKLVGLFLSAGHSVTFVTYRDPRHPNHDICADAQVLGIDIVFTSSKQKQHMFDADIWIDDSPQTIPSFLDLGIMYDGCLISGDTDGL